MNRAFFISRLLLSFASAILITISGRGQKIRDVTSAKAQLLRFDEALFTSSIRIPFNKIEVLDFRFDTSKVGYVSRGRVHDKLIPDKGVREGLTDYLNSRYKNNLDASASRTLLIVLKKLWLEYDAVDRMLRFKELDLDYRFNASISNTICLADFEVFAGSENRYRALVRINHVFTSGKRRNNLYLLTLPFDSLIGKIATLDVEDILSRKNQFTESDLHTNYKNRFNIPVLGVSDFSKGIFLTFEDFKNNKVSYPNFKYKRSSYSVEVTAGESETDPLITEYWGFYDGKDLFVKPGHIPFKVIKQGNTFDMFGSLRAEAFVQPLPSVPTNYGVLSTDYYGTEIPMYPLQVDMETGKVY